MGRWTTAPNRLRIDGAFPGTSAFGFSSSRILTGSRQGVYFDLNVTNTSSVVLSLQNTRNGPKKVADLQSAVHHEHRIDDITHGSQYSFSTTSRIGAPPISLLALVDQDEYVVMPNATGLSAVRMGDLRKDQFHTIRIVAPMTDNGGKGVLQLDGLWLDHGGQLNPVEGSIADTVSEEMDAFDAEGQPEIGASHRLGLGQLLRGHGQAAEGLPFQKPAQPQDEDEEGRGEFKRRKKLVEIVTDDPANFRGRHQRTGTTRSGGADGLLAGVMGWEYLLGEMFSVDHVCIGVEGMCLLHNCVGGSGLPSGLGDVFFRSGPVDSPHFGHPWPFQSYAPDVLVS